jgi:hypothetical protein
MQCDKFENQINELLDRREHPLEDAAVTAHADDCDRCRRRLDACAALLDGMAFTQLPRFSDDFSARVVAQAAAPPVEIHRQNGRRSRWVVRLLSVAALVLIVAIPAAIHGLRTETSGLADNPTPDVEPPSELVSADQPEVAVQGNEARASDGENRIANSEDDEALEEMVVRLRAAWPEVRQSIMTDSLAAAPITDLQDGLVDHVSVPLKPLAVSVTGTINIVRGTFSRGVSQPRPDKPQAGVHWIDDLAGLS